jgi:hypothetical protein
MVVNHCNILFKAVPDCTPDVYLNPETRNKSLAVMRQQHHKLCPLPVSSFKGRKDILQEMHQHFDCDQGSQHIFVLHGLGGAGKSQLSFKFLQDSQAHHRYEQITQILQICHT